MMMSLDIWKRSLGLRTVGDLFKPFLMYGVGYKYISISHKSDKNCLYFMFEYITFFLFFYGIFC